MISQMLDEEMKVSEEFSRRNFGLHVGDEFPEMVREVAKSEKLGASLMIGMLMGSICGKEIAESMKSQGNGKLDWSRIILDNVSTFEPSLSLLYWGIQIGRKLERNQTTTITKLEQNL